MQKQGHAFFDLVACGFQHGDALKVQLKNLAT